MSEKTETLVAINVPEKLAFTSEGRTLPITNLFDEAGDEVELSGLAVSFVAGIDDTWFTGSVDDFGGETIQ